MAGFMLPCMRSCLTDRSPCVHLQGGALRMAYIKDRRCTLLVITAYTATTSDTTRRHNLGFHLSADDIQVYIKFEVTQINILLSLYRIEHCINNVHVWIIIWLAEGKRYFR